MKKKKFLGFAAAALLTIGLAACGNSGSTQQIAAVKKKAKHWSLVHHQHRMQRF